MTVIPQPGPSLATTEDVLHGLIAALTGLPTELVRPRWQPTPPKIPGPETSWCAFGILSRVSPGAQLRPEGAGSWTVESHETLDTLISFYGPQADALALAVREGLRVPLNREGLREANMAFVNAGAIVNAPELVNMTWRRRADLPLTFRRGPAHAVRGQRHEGVVNMPNVESAPMCGLCGFDR